MNLQQIKSSFFVGVFGGFFVLSFLYSAGQYLYIKTDYEKLYMAEAKAAEGYVQSILRNYETILKEISYRIKEENSFFDSEKIAHSLDQAYVYGIESETRERFHALGINWIGAEDKIPVGRFGKMKYFLDFQPDYLKKLEQTPEKLVISSFDQNPLASSHQIINFGIGVKDKHGNYRGFINARVDVAALIEKLNLSKTFDELDFVLLDDHQHVLASSLDLSASDREKLETLIKKGELTGSFLKKKYSFPLKLKIKGFPYSLLFGLERSQFYTLYFKQMMPQWGLLFCFSILFFIFFLFYFKGNVRKWVEKFNLEKQTAHTQLDHADQKNKALEKKMAKAEVYIKSADEADKEARSFHLDLNKRISTSLSDMLNIGNYLLEKLHFDQQKEENPKELMDVFELAYFHSRGVCIKREEEPINIIDVLEDSVVICAKQIHKKDLKINQVINQKIKPFLTDELSVKQLIINILMRAIQNSPKEGEIELKLFLNKEYVCLECKDKGYVSENTLKSEEASPEQVEAFDSLLLEWEDLEKLAKSLMGTLTKNYKPYKGNHFVLNLPQQKRASQKSREANLEKQETNVIRFLNEKKRRGL